MAVVNLTEATKTLSRVADNLEALSAEVTFLVASAQAYAPEVRADFERDSGGTVAEIHEIERAFNV